MKRFAFSPSHLKPPSIDHFIVCHIGSFMQNQSTFAQFRIKYARERAQKSSHQLYDHASCQLKDNQKKKSNNSIGWVEKKPHFIFMNRCYFNLWNNHKTGVFIVFHWKSLALAYFHFSLCADERERITNKMIET